MIESFKSAIVIGATGLVGLALIKQLNLNPHFKNITVVVRHQQDVFQSYDKVQQIVLDDFLLLKSHEVENFTHAFSCLGSTIKKAGSKENFYHIDYEINLHFAKLISKSSTQFLIVSAMGANSHSMVFYNQVKGKLEDQLAKVGLNKVSIIRPSLLIGKRDEARFIEDLSQKVFHKISHFISHRFKYKPVTAEQVAHTMVEAALTQTDSFKIYDNLAIQNLK